VHDAGKVDAYQASMLCRELLHAHLRHQDQPKADDLRPRYGEYGGFASAADEAKAKMLDEAIAAWPPPRGRPKKGKTTPWDRINALFAAYGCGYGEGQALRVQLQRAGIYPARKA